MTFTEVEVWVMVNESGEYEVGTNSDAVGELFSDNCTTREGVRKVCLKLRIPNPTTLTVSGELPADPATADNITFTVG
jgi:hypothetical protein